MAIPESFSLSQQLWPSTRPTRKKLSSCVKDFIVPLKLGMSKTDCRLKTVLAMNVDTGCRSFTGFALKSLAMKYICCTALLLSWNYTTDQVVKSFKEVGWWSWRYIFHDDRAKNRWPFYTWFPSVYQLRGFQLEILINTSVPSPIIITSANFFHDFPMIFRWNKHPRSAMWRDPISWCPWPWRSEWWLSKSRDWANCHRVANWCWPLGTFDSWKDWLGNSWAPQKWAVYPPSSPSFRYLERTSSFQRRVSHRRLLLESLHQRPRPHPR